jgi:uncharacterized LabA/DUF88 family protein
LDRVSVFIDGSHLYHDWHGMFRDLPRPPVMLLDRLVDLMVRARPHRRLARIFYYNAPLPEDDPGRAAQVQFFRVLERVPKLIRVDGRLETRLLRLGGPRLPAACPRCGDALNVQVRTRVEKGTDVNLAVDLLISAYERASEVALIVSRDGDFVRAVAEARRKGMQVEMVVLEGYETAARALGAATDDRILLSRRAILEALAGEVAGEGADLPMPGSA